MADPHRLAEARQRIWIMPVSLVIWATHFMACYITVALWCGMIVGRGGSLSTPRLAIGVFTVVALAGISGVGWLGYRAHAMDTASPPHDEDTPEDRHRFIGFATLLLSGLSAVAVIYSAMTVVFIETCQ